MTTTNDDKIVCLIDNKRVHSIQIHLRDNHPGWDIERYKTTYPEAPLLSEYALGEIARKRKEKSAATASENAQNKEEKKGMGKQPFHEVFRLGNAAAAKNARGEDIMIHVLSDHDDEDAALIPDVDENYIFDIEVTKNVLIGFEMRMTHYIWGMHGTGKTTGFEQVCARTKRPFMRAQHTINTEEAHIVGQYIVKDGATEFQPGPLTIAMIRGYVYCADEYDFALPSVLAVYQPVLEGKPLVIKDAPPEFRVVRPHPNFRFVGTGNTNGGGDETGLYQGTQIQNAANYSRFSIVQEMGYMEAKIEAEVVAGQAGIEKRDAEKLVSIAKEIRESFRGGRISATISPRELIAAARLGLVRGSDWKRGLQLGYINRLSRTDQEVINQYVQRVFG